MAEYYEMEPGGGTSYVKFFSVERVWQVEGGKFLFVDNTMNVWLTLDAADIAEMSRIQLGLPPKRKEDII